MMPVEAVACARKLLAAGTGVVTVPRPVLAVLASCVALGDAYRADAEPKPVAPPVPAAVAAPAVDPAAVEAILDTLEELMDRLAAMEGRLAAGQAAAPARPTQRARLEAFRRDAARLIHAGGPQTAGELADKLGGGVGDRAVCFRLKADPWFRGTPGRGYELTPEGVEAVKGLDAVAAA